MYTVGFARALLAGTFKLTGTSWAKTSTLSSTHRGPTLRQAATCEGVRREFFQDAEKAKVEEDEDQQAFDEFKEQRPEAHHRHTRPQQQAVSGHTLLLDDVMKDPSR